MDAKEYIQSRSLVERTLKFIAGVAKRPDVPDLKTGLLLANTQALKQIIKGKTFHLHRLFLTLQNWQHCKEDPVPSQELFVDEPYNAGVYLNLSKKICACRPLVFILVKSNKAGLEQSGASGKKAEAGSNALCTFMTTNASTTTSAATLSKVGLFGNTLCNNL